MYDVECPSEHEETTQTGLLFRIALYVMLGLLVISWSHECYILYQINSSNIRRLIRQGPPRSCQPGGLSFPEELLNSLIDDEDHNCKLYYQTVEPSPIPNPIEALFALSSRITGSAIGQVVTQVLQGQDKVLQLALIAAFVWLLYRLIVICMQYRKRSVYTREQQAINDAYKYHCMMLQQKHYAEPPVWSKKSSLEIKQLT